MRRCRQKHRCACMQCTPTAMRFHPMIWLLRISPLLPRRRQARHRSRGLLPNGQRNSRGDRDPLGRHAAAPLSWLVGYGTSKARHQVIGTTSFHSMKKRPSHPACDWEFRSPWLDKKTVKLSRSGSFLLTDAGDNSSLQELQVMELCILGTPLAPNYNSRDQNGPDG